MASKGDRGLGVGDVCESASQRVRGLEGLEPDSSLAGDQVCCTGNFRVAGDSAGPLVDAMLRVHHRRILRIALCLGLCQSFERTGDVPQLLVPVLAQ